MSTPRLSLVVLAGLLALPGGEQSTVPQEDSHRGKLELRKDEVSVPLHWFGKTPVIELMINGKGPFRLFLDTGAQGNVLDQDLADELKLPVKGEARVSSPGGKGLPAKIVRLDRVEFGDALLSATQAMSFERSSLGRGKDAPRGVLSAGIFPGFLVTLDYPQSRLTIRRGELPAADGMKVFAYDVKRPLPEIQLDIAGLPVTLHLDSGAPSGITLPLDLAARLPLASKPVQVAKGRRVDQEVIIYGAKLKGQVKLGQYVLENPDLRFQDIPNAPGQVGYEVLRDFAVTLDSKNGRIQILKPKASERRGVGLPRDS